MVKINFQEILNALEMDPATKKAYLAMQRDEQLLIILGMESWLRSEMVQIKKDIIDIKRNSKQPSGSRYREEDETMTTSEKIMNVLTKRFDFWLSILRGALQQVLTIIFLAILYVAFGGKVPIP